MKPLIAILALCATAITVTYLTVRPFSVNADRMVEVSKYDMERARLEFLTACQKRNPLKECVEAK
jgi:hypothetical protein